MISYWIIEDEPFAYEEIKRMMAILHPDYVLQAWTRTVEDAITALSAGRPDLLIVDIRLSDGVCFDIFERMPVNIPVIFTTAYDEYALQAFQVNSIAYLLKPIDEKDLERALTKFETNRIPSPASEEYRVLETSYLSHIRKNRFLVTIGDTFRYVETPDIAFFYSEDKYTYLHTFSDKRYIINYSLEQIGTMLDTSCFFRTSRNCIANIRSIKKVSKFFGSRLTVQFSPQCPQKIIVSRNRVNDFLRWMDGL